MTAAAEIPNWLTARIADGSLNEMIAAGVAELHGAGAPSEKIYDDFVAYYMHQPDRIAAQGPREAAEAFLASYRPDAPPVAALAVVNAENPASEVAAVDGFHLTEAGNADRLIRLHGANLRYVPPWGQWIVWDGCRWQVDRGDVRVTELAKTVARHLWWRIAELDDRRDRERHIRWATRSESAGVISATIKLARGVPGVAIEPDALDADEWLLNCTNGTVDLRTGQLGAHDPELLTTRMAGTFWDGDAQAPTWTAFLERILPDRDVRRFVQKAAGYSLTGSTAEQILLLMIGEGANGKSTFVSTIQHVLGDYAAVAAKDLLVQYRHEAHPTSMADLFRVRFATAVETERGDVLAEAKVKQLTGGDTVKARRMREDFWSFEPTHKLWLAANHRPRIRGTDHAIWRRVRLVPFEVTIPAEERDPALLGKLRAEAPGILRWAIEGCLAWRAEGLDAPQAVLLATEEYRGEQDWFHRFIDDNALELSPGRGRIFTTELAEKYRRWCADEGEPQLSSREFADELRSRGCEPAKSDGKRVWRGIWEAA